MSATARGIYHNLKESEYVVTNGEVELYFSSPVYCKKFLDRYKDERLTLVYKIGQGFENFNFNIISDIALYRKIEKRGQYGKVKGLGMGWHQLDQYALRQMTNKNTLDWSEMRGIK